MAGKKKPETIAKELEETLMAKLVGKTTTSSSLPTMTMTPTKRGRPTWQATHDKKRAERAAIRRANEAKVIETINSHDPDWLTFDNERIWK